jgi:hypothetical protein
MDECIENLHDGDSCKLCEHMPRAFPAKLTVGVALSRYEGVEVQEQHGQL